MQVQIQNCNVKIRDERIYRIRNQKKFDAQIFRRKRKNSVKKKKVDDENV